MIFSRLVDFIRYESRLPGSSTATAYIEATILEVLRDLTAIDLYQECLNVDTVLGIVNASNYALLPSDYQHLMQDRVRYLPAGVDDDSYFLLESEYFDSPNTNVTNRFRISKKRIVLFPNQQIDYATDQLKIDYYGAIISIAQADDFPIPSLEASVKKAVIARCKRMMGSDGTPMENDSAQSLSRSKGDGTTNK